MPWPLPLCSPIGTYLCLGFRPYISWSNFWFNLFSRYMFINDGWKIFTKSSLNRDKSTTSPGYPLRDTRFMIQAPLRVLRKTWNMGEIVCFYHSLTLKPLKVSPFSSRASLNSSVWLLSPCAIFFKNYYYFLLPSFSNTMLTIKLVYSLIKTVSCSEPPLLFCSLCKASNPLNFPKPIHS